MCVLKGRSSARRRGAAATELAVILPVLILIVFGCVDFGRFAYDLIAVTNAARAGAANGTMNNYSASTLGTVTTPNTWKGDVAAAAKAEMADYSSASITVTVPDPTVEANGLRRVDVTVSYQFHTIVNWNWPGVGIPQNPTLTRTVEMRLTR